MSMPPQEAAWGGRLPDPTIREQAAWAAWYVETLYLRDVGAGMHPADAREAALNRFRSVQAAELLAAEAALDLREGMGNVAA